MAVQAPQTDKIGRHAVPAGDGAALVATIERLRARAERALSAPVRVVSCYEAGFDAFWIHRLLVGHGIENQVIDPVSIQVDRRARRVKTDVIDVEALVRALMAWQRGERRVCSMVRVPSLAEEDRRRVSRERERLMRERLQHVNRIKNLLATQGVWNYEPLRKSRPPLEALETGDGHRLPPRLKAEIERELKRLDLVREQLAVAEGERDAAVSHPNNGTVGMLTRLRGIGPESAHLLYVEALYRRFANRRDIAAYAGLAPSLWASGGLRHEQGISKAGNPRVRRAMVELAWIWLRYQPESALSRWFHERVGDARGRVKRIAIVAVARKLLVALWRFVTSGVVPEGATLKAT